MNKQKTIGKKVSLVGIGLHSGKEVTLSIKPAPVNTGVIYIRNDLTPNVIIKSSPELIREIQLCTALVNDDGVKIQTIEHLSAALSSLGIDNVYVEVNEVEIPILDGSSIEFVELINRAGIVEQEEFKQYLKIIKPIRVEDGDKWAELVPNEGGTEFEFTISFDHPSILKENSYFYLNLTKDSFIEELSRARTFGFLKEIDYLKSIGLCLGGSLDCAIVLDDNGILNENGLRFKDEFVRHKMLDAIGDLYLCNKNILGKYRAYKSGHDLNNILLRKVMQEKDSWKLVNQ